MKKQIVAVFVVICAAVFCSRASFSEEPALDLQSQITALKAELTQLRADIDSLKAEFADIKANPPLRKQTAKERYEEKRQKTMDRVEYFKQLKHDEKLRDKEDKLKKEELKKARGGNKSSRIYRTGTTTRPAKKRSKTISRQVIKK